MMILPRRLTRDLSIVFALLISPLGFTQVVRQVTNLDSDHFNTFAIDDSGQTLVATLGHDSLGLNPQHASQLFSWSLPSLSLSQVTLSQWGNAESVSISDDGSLAVFVSSADPLGTNHDGSLELFHINLTSQAVVQLTSDPGPGAADVFRASLAGNGDRVVFLSNVDPLGTNSNHDEQLFTIKTDGTQLVQLTVGMPDSKYGKFSISDNGAIITYQRVEFTALPPFTYHAIYAINSNGTNSLELANGPVSGPEISGNGALVVYERSGQLETVPRTGGAATILTTGKSPSITDDGAWVYYSGVDTAPPADSEIFEISTTLLSPTQITFTTGLSNQNPVVSGDRTHIAFVVRNGAYPGGFNPDGGPELVVMAVDGTNINQLTSNVPSHFDNEPAITPDGTRIVFKSSGNYANSNPGAQGRVFLLDNLSGQVTPLSSASASSPTISQDGALIAFLSNEDFVGMNPQRTDQVFTTDNAGASIQQVTSGSGLKAQPVLARSGSFIVFEAWENFTGGNPDGTGELFKVSLVDSTITQLTADLQGGNFKNTQLSDDDLWIVFNAQTDFDGLNPGGLHQVFRVRTDGSIEQRITTDVGATAFTPTVSSDGNRIAYASNADPFGTNSDGNYELFLWDASGPTTQQLTFTSGQDDFGLSPTITPDGQFVFFFSTNPFFEDRPGRPKELYRLTVADLSVERAAGLSDPRGLFSSSDFDSSHPKIDVDADGRAIVAAEGNLAGSNMDVDSQLWLVAFDEPSHIAPGKAAPTVVNWPATPQALRYDVIRGDVANLSQGAGTVDLGLVVCLEDDSPDNSTDNFEDVTQPDPGQAFFYLFRGSQGNLDGAGSWGQGASGERFPSVGNCPQ